MLSKPYKLYNAQQSKGLVATRYYRIQPENIDTSNLWISCFSGSLRMNKSARHIVMYYQHAGILLWHGVKRKDLQDYYNILQQGRHKFYFHGLLRNGMIIRNEFGYYFVTYKFVNECCREYPVRLSHGAIMC